MTPAEDAGGPAAAVVVLAAGTALRRFRVRAADLFLAVLDGEPSVAVAGRPATVLRAGDLAVCRAGEAVAVVAGPGTARVLAVALPGGPEAILGVLAASPPMAGAHLLPLAADLGVDLLLDPLPEPLDALPGPAGPPPAAHQRPPSAPRHGEDDRTDLPPDDSEETQP